MSEQMVAENLKLTVSRVIGADRARVYAAWTKPELIRKWFAPGNMVVPNASSDLRVGGGYRVEMQGSMEAGEGKSGETDLTRTSAASGVYRQIVPNEMLAFTWRGDWDPSEETLVTVRFKDVPTGTEVTLIHERFATAASMGKHEYGWQGSLAKLAKVLEA